MEKIASLRKAKITVSFLVVFLLIYMVVGAIFYHYVEHWSWLDSFYFTVITLATIGYGDLAPRTDVGKLFTMPYVFVGIGMFVAVANSFLKLRAHVRLGKFEARKAVNNGKEAR